MAGASVLVRGLRHRYGDVPVLDGVDLRLEPGEHVALVGASGSGKSTLLALLGGLEAPQEGDVEVDGVALRGLSGAGLAALRRDVVGFVFQHFGLLDALTARENVELACTLAGLRGTARRRRADELLADVGLAHRAGHRPAQLSGGERQRVAIARALVGPPRLLLADEPTGNLDQASGAVVLDALDRMAAASGCTLLLVTHDRDVAARAQRTVGLAGGRAVDPAVPV